MQNTYRRPGTLEEAITLLQAEGAVVLAGGTVVNASPHPGPVELIDLQALGLETIQAAGGAVEVGAMVRLQTLVESDAFPSLLRDLAKREGPNTLRAVATLGGTVAAGEAESELLAGLLAFEAVVTIEGPSGKSDLPLPAFLSDPARSAGSIVTSVSVRTAGTAAAERTARTPADRPIVTAVGRLGDGGALHLALTGVASTPILVGLDELGSLDPPGDFRGSVAYRRHLAETLVYRLVDRLGVAT